MKSSSLSSSSPTKKGNDVGVSDGKQSESAHRGAALTPSASRPRVLGAGRTTAAEALAASTAISEAPLKSLQEKLDVDNAARTGDAGSNGGDARDSSAARNEANAVWWDDNQVEFDDEGDSEMFSGGAVSAAMQTSLPATAGNAVQSQRMDGREDSSSNKPTPSQRHQQPDFLKNYIDQASHRRTQQLKKADAMLNKLLRPFPIPSTSQANGKSNVTESESLQQPTTVELEALLSLCANQNSSFSSCAAGLHFPGSGEESLEAGDAASIPLFATADFQQLLAEVLNNSIRAIQIYDDFSGRFTDIELYSLAKVMPYNLSVEAITLSSLKESTWSECDDDDDDDGFDEAFLFGSSDDEFSGGGHVQTWRAPPQGGKKAAVPKQKTIISKECFMYFLESLTSSRVSFIDLSTSALYELMDDDIGETLAALAHTNPNLRTILLATTTKLKEYGMGGTEQADEPVNPDDLHVEDVVANIKDEVLDEIDLVCQFNDSNSVDRTRAQEAQPPTNSPPSKTTGTKKKNGNATNAASGGSRFSDSAALVDERRLKWECTSQLMPRLLQILNSKKLRINACVSYVLFDGSCPNSSDSGDGADGGGTGCLLSHKPVGYVNHALDGFYHDVYLQKLEELHSASDPANETYGGSDGHGAQATSLRTRAKKAQHLHERQQRYLNEAANYYAFTSTMGEKDVSSVGPSLPIMNGGEERKPLSLVQQFGTQNEWEKLLQQQQPKAGASWRAEVPVKKGAAKKGGAATSSSSPSGPTVKLDLARLVPEDIPTAVENPVSVEDAPPSTEPLVSKSAAKRRRKAKKNAEAAAAAAAAAMNGVQQPSSSSSSQQHPSRLPSKWKTDELVLVVSVTMASVMVAVALGALLAERYSRKP